MVGTIGKISEVKWWRMLAKVTNYFQPFSFQDGKKRGFAGLTGQSLTNNCGRWNGMILRVAESRLKLLPEALLIPVSVQT